MKREMGWASNLRDALGVLSSVAVAALLFVACGGSDVTAPKPQDFSGEYRYIVTGAGGTCSNLPRATGEGVRRIIQTDDRARDCRMRDVCDGVTCGDGYVAGRVFTIHRRTTLSEGACTFVQDSTTALEKDADGSLSLRMERQLTYGAGDCTALALPCSDWQTSTSTPCPSACYDTYCDQRPGSFEGAQPGAEAPLPRATIGQ